MNKVTKKVSVEYLQVLEVVKEAYADCVPVYSEEISDAEGDKRRNLNFRSSISVSPEEAYRITKATIGSGYNNFEPKLLKLFKKDCQIQIAREGSVCIYVKGEVLPKQNQLLADEYDKEENGWHRIWWD